MDLTHIQTFGEYFSDDELPNLIFEDDLTPVDVSDSRDGYHKVLEEQSERFSEEDSIESQIDESEEQPLQDISFSSLYQNKKSPKFKTAFSEQVRVNLTQDIAEREINFKE